jgi:hypothetical protein
MSDNSSPFCDKQYYGEGRNGEGPFFATRIKRVAKTVEIMRKAVETTGHEKRKNTNAMSLSLRS